MRILVRTLVTVSIFCAIAQAAGDDALVAHWDFNEGRGKTLHDRSGNENHGKIHGAKWVKCGRGHALKFDGSGDYVDCGKKPGLKLTTDFAIVAWVKLQASPIPNYDTNWYIVDNEVYPQNGFMARIDGAAGKLTFRTSLGGRRSAGFGSRTLDNNTFYHVAFVRKSGLVTMYVDTVADATLNTQDPLPPTEPFRISSPDQSFQGLIDDLRAYDKPLTRDALLALYKSGAAERDKDTSWFGKFQVKPFFYFDTGTVDLEANLLGIVPLSAGDEVVLTMGQPQEEPVKTVRMEAMPESARKDFTFTLDKLPAANYEIRIMLKNKNRIKTQEVVSFRYPPLPPEVPAPAKKRVAPLPPRPDPVPYKVQLLKGGGFVLTVKGETFPVESRFSYPRGGENRLTASNIPAFSADGWRAKAVSTDKSRHRVEAEGKHYRLLREIRCYPNRVNVKDTFTNKTAKPVGIIISNRINIRGRDIKKAFLKGYTATTAAKQESLKTNPTIFLSKKGLGLGMIALDDVYIVQSRGAYDEKAANLYTDTFALDAGASYTLEWAVYPNATGDYYDFINAVRRDEGRNNTTVAGGFAGAYIRGNRRAVPTEEHLEMRGAKHVLSSCLARIADDPSISLEGIEFTEYPKEKALLKKQMEAIRAVLPDAKVMFHVAHSLYATNKPDSVFPDSRVINADGKQAVYPYNYLAYTYLTKERYDAGWRWWIYYPTLDNSFGKALLRSADVMVDEMSCTGVFMDGFLWAYGGEYTYDRWDGHTAEIDPKTRTIKRKMGSVLLLSQPALVAFTRKMTAKGAQVIGNNTVPTRTICRENVIFDKEITEGPSVHLLPTPITMGNPSAIHNEQDVYEDVLSKLKWGNLYMYYGEGKLTYTSVPQQMYPITVCEIRSGLVRGKERLISTHSGVYGWRDSRDLHFAYRYDGRGRQTRHAFLSTVDADAVRTQVNLDESETAVLKRIPVSLHAKAPVNLVCTKYDKDGVEFILNGSSEVDMIVKDGGFPVQRGVNYRVSIGAAQRVIQARDDSVSVSLTLDRPTTLGIEKD